MQKVAVLYDASQAVLSAPDLEGVLHQILIIARDYFHLQNVAILLLDEEKQELHVRCQIGWARQSGPHASATGVRYYRGSRPAKASDLCSRRQRGPTLHSVQLSRPAPNLLSLLIVQGAVVGVLDCQSDKPDYFERDTIDLLTLFSTQASIAIQNARLNALERRRARELQAINAIAQQSTAVLDVRELLSKVCPLIQEKFQLPQISVLLKDEDDLVLALTMACSLHAYPMADACPPESAFGEMPCLAVKPKSNTKSIRPKTISFSTTKLLRKCAFPCFPADNL